MRCRQQNASHRIALLVGWLFICFSVNAEAEIAVVVHSSNSVKTMTLEELNHVFTKKIKKFSNGLRIIPVGQSNKNLITASFNKKVLGKSNRQLRHFWTRRMFSSNGSPPRVLVDDLEVIDFVSANRKAIGYINKNAVTDGVKILLIIP